jgi:hypothetical protein
VSKSRDSIRSYQRIFRPERRIYSIDGRPLPVPGGVPLRWLAFASGSLVASLVLSAHSLSLAVFFAVAGGVAGFGVGGRRAAIASSLCVFVGFEVGGWIVSALDWPLRLIVLPAAVATLATQTTPDGRTAERFALSWLLLRLLPARRSLGRDLNGGGQPEIVPGKLWVGADEHSPHLRPARIRGAAKVTFTEAVEERPGRRKIRVRRLGWHRRRGRVAQDVTVGPGEILEVRP